MPSPSLQSALIDELIAVVGADQVLTKSGDLYLYSFDSALDRALPAAVVLPGTPDQVGSVVRILHRHKRAYVARGAATSLCGGPVPLQNGVVVSLTRLKKIGKLDQLKKEIMVEPGVVNLRLQQAVDGAGLFYPPDPGSQKACTIGGNVATNAGGPHCLKYGVTSNFVAGLDIVLPDGQPLQIKTDDPGYDLTGFFVGSEGTLGIVTRVRLKLLPKPVQIRTMLVSFPSIEDAIQAVTDIIGAGLLPATLEAMDKITIQAVEAFVHAGYPVDAEAVLLIEVDGGRDADLDSQVRRIQDICGKNNQQEFRFAKDEKERQKLWEGRRGAYPAMARLAPNVLVEDGAVPRTKLPEALRAIKQIAEEADLRVGLLFHAGDGNLHPNIIFDERDEEYTQIVKEAGYKMLKVCVDLGGTISGEHGIGSDKREAMKWLFTRETLALFRRLKNAFDPENLCNPDKLIPLVSIPPAPKTELRTEEVPERAFASPASEEELVGLVKKYRTGKTFFGIQGTGSRYRIRESMVVSVKNLNKILDFDTKNLTLTAQGGALLTDLRAAVEAEKRYLWIAGAGSLGGAISTKASVAPPIRDLILGMRILLPTGEIAVLGAKTMKNVAGYDAAKLLIGSFGTLGAILDVTLRLFPYPTEMKEAPTQPFVFHDIHRRIKKAFDPDGILGTRTMSLTADEIKAQPKGDMGPGGERMPENIEEKFWF